MDTSLAVVLLAFACVALVAIVAGFAFVTFRLLARLLDDATTKLATLADAQGMAPLLAARRATVEEAPRAHPHFTPVPANDDDAPERLDRLWKRQPPDAPRGAA